MLFCIHVLQLAVSWPKPTNTRYQVCCFSDTSRGFLTITIHVCLSEESPPTGASTGVNHGPQELTTAQLHCLHFRSHLIHMHRHTQQQRQNHQSPHAGHLTVSTVCTVSVGLSCSETNAGGLCHFSWFLLSLVASLWVFCPGSSLCEDAPQWISRWSSACISLLYIASTFHSISVEYLSTSSL